jgi:hypothetical protein
MEPFREMEPVASPRHPCAYWIYSGALGSWILMTEKDFMREATMIARARRTGLTLLAKFMEQVS